MSGANLTRVDALERMKSVMAAFIDDAKMALGSVEMETRRVIDQLERDVPYHWNQQILIGRDEIAQAKAALARKRLQRTDNYIPDTSEEEEALHRAKRRVETAEYKLESIKKWRRKLEEAWNEYQGASGQLADVIGGSPARPIADLNRMIKALDSYLSLQAPEVAADPLSDGGSVSDVTSMARPAEEPAQKSDEAEKKIDQSDADAKPVD